MPFCPFCHNQRHCWTADSNHTITNIMIKVTNASEYLWTTVSSTWVETSNIHAHVGIAKDCVPLACYTVWLRLFYPRLERLSGFVCGQGHSAGQTVHSHSDCDPIDVAKTHHNTWIVNKLYCETASVRLRRNFPKFYMDSSLTAEFLACHFYLTLRWLMSYIYGAPILDVSRSHTTTQHSR